MKNSDDQWPLKDITPVVVRAETRYPVCALSDQLFIIGCSSATRLCIGLHSVVGTVNHKWRHSSKPGPLDERDVFLLGVFDPMYPLYGASVSTAVHTVDVRWAQRVAHYRWSDYSEDWALQG